MAAGSHSVSPWGGTTHEPVLIRARKEEFYMPGICCKPGRITKNAIIGSKTKKPPTLSVKTFESKRFFQNVIWTRTSTNSINLLKQGNESKRFVQKVIGTQTLYNFYKPSKTGKLACIKRGDLEIPVQNSQQ